jgi:hypothetical protein
MATTKNTTKIKNRWSPADRQAFADGARLRAKRHPNKKRLASREACRKGSLSD